MSTLTHDAAVETTEAPATADPGGHDRFSHVVKKNKIAEGYLLSREVIALCGKVFVPRYDPMRYAVCPTCKDILNTIQSGEEE